MTGNQFIVESPLREGGREGGREGDSGARGKCHLPSLALPPSLPLHLTVVCGGSPIRAADRPTVLTSRQKAAIKRPEAQLRSVGRSVGQPKWRTVHLVGGGIRSEALFTY